jgi:hypothetical protein
VKLCGFPGQTLLPVVKKGVTVIVAIVGFPVEFIV